MLTDPHRNSVVPAVSAAIVDLANSESLKLAQSVDPQGRRTIGTLTKLNLMDAGTHAHNVLTGRVYPLKLGFIGVVNRSQQDINVDKSVSDSLDSETDLFKSHPQYHNIAHRNRTKFLAKTLNQVRLRVFCCGWFCDRTLALQVLMNYICDKLPDQTA